MKVAIMEADWLGLQDARVLVAGAGGLGTACVRGFLDAGAHVVVTDQDAGRLAELADLLDLDGKAVVEADTEEEAGLSVLDFAVEALVANGVP